MRESGQQLERLSKQSGASSVEKARPYYEARMRLRQVTGFSFYTIYFSYILSIDVQGFFQEGGQKDPLEC